MEFADYIASKKIDTAAFRATEPGLYQEWESLFAQVSPVSFAQQKLFLINGIRRRFPLAEEAVPKSAAKPAPKPRVNIPKR